MTALELQDDLVKEVERILKDVRTRKVSGEEASGVTGYRQALPEVMEDEEDSSQFFPYCIVRLNDAVTEDDNDPWQVRVNFFFGVYDDNRKSNGHQHIMVMIQRVADRFAAEPLLNKKFRAQQKMEWALPDENTYPYYFGGLEIAFSVPKIGRREPKYD